MKTSKIALLLIIGGICGAVISYFVYSQIMPSNKKEEISVNDVFKEPRDMYLPFKEEYLIGNTEDNGLYIDFDESSFTIKEGEQFQYKKAVTSTNGKFFEESVNSKKYDLKEGQYIVIYKVHDKKDKTKIRQYVKLLTVIK